MAWNINAYNIPRIRSYEEALKVYESATPSPKSDGWRALAAKRDTSKVLHLDSDNSIRIRYHHTDVVTYKPDGRVVVHPHDSVNTVAFADRVLPNGVMARSFDGHMWVGDQEGLYQPVKDELMFIQGVSKWFVDKTTVAPVTWYQLDRSKAAAIRKTMKPFLEWVAAVKRVGAKITWGPGFHTTPPILKEHLNARYIPEELYPELALRRLEYRDLYVLGGAVTKLLAPCGALPKKNDYECSSLWSYV